MMRSWPAVALRYRVGLLVFAAAALGVTNAARPADVDAFAGAGKAIVSGHFAAVYTQPANQGGPIQLVLNWLLMIGSPGSGPSRLVVTTVNVALVLAAVGLCRRHQAQRDAAGQAPERWSAVAGREVLVGVLALFWLTPGGLWDGHPVEVLISVLWLLAVDSVGAGRWVRAGIALGVGAAIAPWGVFGFPAVLACRRLDVSLRAGAAGIAVASALYLPFVLGGHFAVFGYTWAVSPGTLVHLVMPGLSQVTWTIRLVQAGIVSTGTGCAALLLRRNRDAPTIAVLVAAVLRVATDPVQMDYYWTSVGLVSIALVAATAGLGRAWWAAAAAYLAWAGASSGATLVASGICLLLARPIAAALRERPPAPTAESLDARRQSAPRGGHVSLQAIGQFGDVSGRFGEAETLLVRTVAPDPPQTETLTAKMNQLRA